jgi:putative toxin-antitoxin system antitoxin component (TIGR02293 family)
MKFQENGDCIFLNMIDGAYSCSVYEARSVTCRGYPSTDIQIETCRVNSDRGTAFRWTHDGFQCIESPDIEIEVPSPRSVYGQCIGVRARSREDTIGILKKGLPVSSFEKLHKRMDISSQDLARFTHIALRTLQRRRQKKRFQTDESERLLRVGILFDKAIEVLGSIEAARDWMRTPKKSLADQTPLEYCATEPGAREVEDLLGRTEHGVFS